MQRGSTCFAQTSDVPEMEWGIAPDLVKIPARSFEPAHQRAVIDEPLGDEVHDFAFAFHYAVHAQQPGAQQLAALRVGEIAPHDHVHVAGFVFERTNTTPEAVSGRWRPTTMPAARAKRPCGNLRSSEAWTSRMRARRGRCATAYGRYTFANWSGACRITAGVPIVHPRQPLP